MFYHDSGVDFVGEDGGFYLLMEAKISDCLLGLGYINFALGGCEVRLEACPLFVSCGLEVPFSDIASEYVGVCDDDESNVD